MVSAFSTWTCHVCGEKRPDSKISVHSRPWVVDGQTLGQENIRYCNDRQSCIDGAKNVSFQAK